MAELATPAAATMSTIDAGASKPASKPASKSKAPVAKPERPDEEQYKKSLAAAEKELQTAKDHLVRASLFYRVLQ